MYLADNIVGAGFRHEVAPLPFELRVLETCIDDICTLCSGLTKELENFANPSLDALTHAVRPWLALCVKGRYTECVVVCVIAPCQSADVI